MKFQSVSALCLAAGTVFFAIILMGATAAPSQIVRPQIVRPQVVRPLDRPSPWLSPVPPGDAHEWGFDAFSQTPAGQPQVQPWQLWDIPFGSWGSQGQWDLPTLHATTIKRTRQKFIQKLHFDSGWIVKDGEQGFGNVFSGAGIAMAVPLGTINNVIVVAPRFQVDWLDGPRVVDVPAQLYSTQIDIGWRLKFNQQLSTIVGARPGWFHDGKSPVDGFRLSGLAVVSYEQIPDKLTWMAGVVYLDRNDFNWLPAVGMNWYPSPDLRIDLVFPKPKIARRVGHIPYLSEDWVYVAGSIGGNTWSVLRQTGVPDELTLRDYQMVAGLERVITGARGFYVEAGVVFGRRLEYESSGTPLRFGTTGILQAGVNF